MRQRLRSSSRRRLVAALAAVAAGITAGALGSGALGVGAPRQDVSTVAALESPADTEPAAPSSAHPLAVTEAEDLARAVPTPPPAPAPPGPAGPSFTAGPHRFAAPPGGRAVLGPPDATPLAAAAGTEPGEMGPLAHLPAGWIASVHRFAVAGVTRSYLLVRPAASSPARLPVVVVLHGRNQTPAGIERITHTPAVTGPAILVFPAGYGRSWDAGGCCGAAHARSVNDVAFLTQTIHRILAGQRDAAPGEVFMLGFSNGGRMAYRVACDAPGLLAGIAAVEAVPVDRCTTPVALPVVVVASSHDPLLSILASSRPKVMQGYLEPSVQATVGQWRRLDGCAPTGEQLSTGTATVDTWTRCRGSGRVAYVLYRGGGHLWPEGSTPTEERAGTPSAGTLAWAWLRRGVVVTTQPT